MSIQENTWTHVAVTFDSGTTRLYINGTLDSEKDLGASSFSTVSDPIRVGDRDLNSDGTDDFNGRIDAFRYYTRPLSASEVQQLYDQVAPAPDRIYVDADATGDGSGTSWTDAYTDLQTAINNAGFNSEIWVAEGVYTPDSEGDRFTITGNEDGLDIYGGFDGTETDRSDRDPTAHRTVLSGDVDENDNNKTDGVTPTVSDIQGYNSHTVVFLDGTTGGNITSDTRIDGITVSGGQANGSSDDDGGGLFCDGSAEATDVCAPTLTNVRFIGNDANFTGGAISFNAGNHARTFQPTVRDAVFRANTAGNGGGGIHAGGAVELYVTNSVFSGNSADSKGGAISLDHTTAGNAIQPQITNVTFVDNETTGDGGGSQFFRKQFAPGADHRQQHLLAKHSGCRGKPNLGECGGRDPCAGAFPHTSPDGAPEY